MLLNVTVRTDRQCSASVPDLRVPVFIPLGMRTPTRMTHRDAVPIQRADLTGLGGEEDNAKGLADARWALLGRS